MRTNNKTTLGQRRENIIAHGTTGVKDNTDKQKIKLVHRDQSASGNQTKNNHERRQPSSKKQILSNAVREDKRTPSHNRQETSNKRNQSRSGRPFNHDSTNVTVMNQARKRTFQLMKDRQAFEKVWMVREEGAGKDIRVVAHKINNRKYQMIEDATLPPRPEERIKPSVAAVIEVRENRFRFRNTHMNQAGDNDGISNSPSAQYLENIAKKNHIQSGLKIGNDNTPVKQSDKGPQDEKHSQFRIKATSKANQPDRLALRKAEETKVDKYSNNVHQSHHQTTREEVVFEPFDSTDQELIGLLDEYVKRIDNQDLVKTQQTDNSSILDSMTKPTWLRVWRRKKLSGINVLENKIVGLMIYQQDTSMFRSRRVLISHASAEDYSNYVQFLKEGVEYIFSKDSCTEIYYQFKHIMKEDKLVLPTELKDAVKSAGFKWRLMTNSFDGNTRITIFESKRPVSLQNGTKGEECIEPLRLVGMSILSDSKVTLSENHRADHESKDTQGEDRCKIGFKSVQFDGSFLVFACMLKYMGSRYREITDDRLKDMGRIGELITQAKLEQVGMH